MKILFYLGHPAHYHLLKNIIHKLKQNGHAAHILIKNKDILEDLLKISNFEYLNILPEGRKDSKLGIAMGLVKRDWRIFQFCLKSKADLMIGTSAEITHVGKLLKIPSINLSEDDFDAVPLFSSLGYPWASSLLTPISCQTGKWENKTTHYEGFHELAYLHPNNFSPNTAKINEKIDLNNPFFLLRFAKLTAHHDKGKTGITTEIAQKIINLLRSHGNVYITSERELEPEFEPYRIQINPNDIHHALYYADIYIGDSQTMAAEAAVLGTPSLRFNDFIGKLGYLDELEHKYGLTHGIKTTEPKKLYGKIKELLNTPNLKQEWQKRRRKMLSEKIDVSSFMVWFIENYPESVKIMKENLSYQDRFK